MCGLIEMLGDTLSMREAVPETLALGFTWRNGGEDEGCWDSRACLSDMFSQWGQTSVPRPSSQVETNHRMPGLEDLSGFTEGENETQQEVGTCPRSDRETVLRLRSTRKKGPLCPLQVELGFEKEEQDLWGCECFASLPLKHAEGSAGSQRWGVSRESQLKHDFLYIKWLCFQT